MEIGYIYRITSPSGKVYIGQTLNINDRLNRYKYMDCKRQTKLYNSIKKYGWDNHKIEIVEEIIVENNNREQLDVREKYWISEFNSLNNGLNCNIGGGSNYGYRHTETL